MISYVYAPLYYKIFASNAVHINAIDHVQGYTIFFKVLRSISINGLNVIFNLVT